MPQRTMTPIGAAALCLAGIHLVLVSSSSTDAPVTTSQTIPDLTSIAASTPQNSDPTTNSDSIKVSDSSSPSSDATTNKGPTTVSVSTSLNSDLTTNSGLSGSRNESESSLPSSDTTTNTAQRSPTISQLLSTSGYVTIPTTASTSINSTAIEPSGSNSTNNTTSDQDNLAESKVTNPIIPEQQEESNTSNDEKQTSTPSNSKGIHIAVWSVIVVIVIGVLIGFVYWMYQKKPPAAENMEVKVSTQTPESVKLISVKASG